MKKILAILFIMLQSVTLHSQPEIALQLREKFGLQKGFEAEIKVHLEIPGISIPDKIVSMRYEQGKPLKIKAKGLVLLPKKGFGDLFVDLFNKQVHWIDLGTERNISSFKLVALDPKSDWITADIKVDNNAVNLSEVILTTRESGDFTVNYTYGKEKYPEKIVISFVTDKFAVPLKFLGKSENDGLKDPKGKVKGKITLDFTRMIAF